jgi:hypothetical protein
VPVITISTGPARSPNEISQTIASGARKKQSSHRPPGRRNVQKTTGWSRQLSIEAPNVRPAQSGPGTAPPPAVRRRFG